MKIIIKQILQFPVTSFMLDQSIFLVNQFLNTFSLCSSINMGGQVSHPYVTRGLIRVLSSKRPTKQYVENTCLVIEDKNLK